MLDLACGEGVYAREFKRSGSLPVTAVDLSEQKMLAHELGHALGLYHAAPGQGFVMTSGHPATWPVAEQLISQTSFEVGPSVMYAGVVPPAPVSALPLAGLLLLVDGQLGDGWRKMAESEMAGNGNLKRDPCVECAPESGQVQAAVLTGPPGCHGSGFTSSLNSSAVRSRAVARRSSNRSKTKR